MKDFIKFLGTAGARIVVARQLRSSAGIWISLDGTNLYIHPGPGALVECFHNRPVLDPMKLDGILLSHKHLDHSGDINAMIEAMSLGGHKKKGDVFVPADAMKGDPVVLKYVRRYARKIHVLREGGKYRVGALSFTTPVKHIHGGHTYGFKIKGKRTVISYIADTKYFKKLAGYYKDSDILVISVLREEPSDLDHLCIDEAKTIIKEAKPRLAILTQFGRFLLRANPKKIAASLTKELGIKVVAAEDGMKIDLKWNR